SLCLVDVVLLRPWGTPFLRLVRENTDAFAQLPAPIHRAVVESYIAGASHRRLRPEETAMLADPWTDGDGQPAFYRQIAQADERYTEELEPLLGKVDVP